MKNNVARIIARAYLHTYRGNKLNVVLIDQYEDDESETGFEYEKYIRYSLYIEKSEH